MSVSVSVRVTNLTRHISGVSEPIHTKFGVVVGWLGGHRAVVRQGGGTGGSGGRDGNVFFACNNFDTPYLRRL